MRTLVAHFGGIGDFLLACPAVGHLARDGPVELLGQRARLELAVAGGLAAAAHDAARVGFETVFSDPDRRVREFLARFDRAVVWMRDDGAMARALRGCGIKDVRVFPGLPPEGWQRHASEYYLDCLGIEAAPPLRLKIAPSSNAVDIVIHPGSGGKRKNWPIERFAALAQRLASAGRTVLWCLGPAEEDFSLGLECTVIWSEPLLSVARTLAAARLYIGNDSGITHLSAAVQCPTVAIFGPSDPRVWAPRGDQVTVVHDVPWPTVERVLDALPNRRVEPGCARG